METEFLKNSNKEETKLIKKSVIKKINITN